LRYGEFKLENWVLENIDELLRDSELDTVSWTALPYWAENPRLVDLEELIGIEVHHERPLENDRVEFFCDLSLIGIFQCSILFGSWKSVIHSRQIEWVDEESSDMWTEIGLRSVGTFLARIVFDLNTATVVEHDVVAIPHDIYSALDSLENLKAEFEGDG